MPTISDTWDDPFETQLKDGTFISNGDNIIRSVRRAIEERVRREHGFGEDDESTHGLHQSLTTKIFTDEPATRPDGTTLDSDDKGRLSVSSSTLKIWDGSSWQAVKSRYLSPFSRWIVSNSSDRGEFTGVTASWLDTLGMAYAERISCIMKSTNFSSGPLYIKHEFIGGYMRAVTGSPNVYTLTFRTTTGDFLPTVSFKTGDTDYWYRKFPTYGGAANFFMIIQG